MAFLLRTAALVALCLAATGTLTYAAEQRLGATTPAKAPVAPAKPQPLLVPNVVGQVYVFAKGILEDAGLAWQVPTANGYAANTVVSQSPPAGTRLVDTGAPVVTLALKRNRGYPQRGTPDNASPYRGTALRLAR